MQQRTAVITGGSSGIGRAVADRLAMCGASVTIVDVNEPDEQLPPSARYMPCDLRCQDDVDRLAETVSDHAVDLLVISAGLGVHERLGQGDPAKWQAVLDTNVMGALRVIRLYSQRMTERKQGGDVVIVSSVAAEHRFEYGGVYGASKAALNALAETLRLELQPHVRVLCIMPGVVDTPFFSNMVSEGPTVQSIGWGALSADDVAESVQWALTRPRHVAVNTLIMRPAAQVL